MKKIITLLIITLVFASCGGGEKSQSVKDIIATGDLKKIKEKKEDE